MAVTKTTPSPICFSLVNPFYVLPKIKIEKRKREACRYFETGESIDGVETGQQCQCQGQDSPFLIITVGSPLFFIFPVTATAVR